MKLSGISVVMRVVWYEAEGKGGVWRWWLWCLWWFHTYLLFGVYGPGNHPLAMVVVMVYVVGGDTFLFLWALHPLNHSSGSLPPSRFSLPSFVILQSFLSLIPRLSTLSWNLLLCFTCFPTGLRIFSCPVLSVFLRMTLRGTWDSNRLAWSR